VVRNQHATEGAGVITGMGTCREAGYRPPIPFREDAARNDRARIDLHEPCSCPDPIGRYNAIVVGEEHRVVGSLPEAEICCLRSPAAAVGKPARTGMREGVDERSDVIPVATVDDKDLLRRWLAFGQ